MAVLGAVLWCGCGRGGPVPGTELTQPLTSTASPVSGRWALGANVIRGLPANPGQPQDEPESPFAQLELDEDGTFLISFGAGCVVQGLRGAWVATPVGARLTMQPDGWQTWTDGVSSPLRPTQLDAVRDGADLRITGVDEKGRPIDQRWRPY